MAIGSTWPTCKIKGYSELSDIPELIEFSHRAVEWNFIGSDINDF